MTLKSQNHKITIFTKLRFCDFVPHSQKCKRKNFFSTMLFTHRVIFEKKFGRYKKKFRPLHAEHRKGNSL